MIPRLLGDDYLLADLVHHLWSETSTNSIAWEIIRIRSSSSSHRVGRVGCECVSWVHRLAGKMKPLWSAFAPYMSGLRIFEISVGESTNKLSVGCETEDHTERLDDSCPYSGSKWLKYSERLARKSLTWKILFYGNTNYRWRSYRRTAEPLFGRRSEKYGLWLMSCRSRQR